MVASPSATRTDVVTTSNESADDIQAIAAYFAWLYEGQRGYIRLNAGVADDETPSGIRMLMPSRENLNKWPYDPDTRFWCYVDPERDDLYLAAAEVALRLRDQFGNVYTTRTTFKTKQATKEHANPSPILFVDDAPLDPPLPFSLYLETGRGPGQGFYKCDRPTTQDDARAVAYTLGGDKSGSNENKILRIPRTFNTKSKHGGRFPVRVIEPLGQVYRLDRLRAVYAPQNSAGDDVSRAYRADSTEKSSAVTVEAPCVADEAVEQVRRCIGLLLDREGIPRRLSRTSHGRAILRAAMAGWPDSQPDYSAERYRLVRSLIMHGYPDVEIAALLWHFMPWLNGSGKSISYWVKDIQRMIQAERAKQPGVTPTASFRTGTRVPTLSASTPSIDSAAPPKSRARRDRPQKVQGAVGYLEWLRCQQDPQSGTVMLSQRQCAARLGCCVRTIKRYEALLQATGKIERQVFDRRQAGCLFVLDTGDVTTSGRSGVTTATEIDDVTTSAPEGSNSSLTDDSAVTTLPVDVVTANPNRMRTDAPNVCSTSHEKDTALCVPPPAVSVPLAPPDAPLVELCRAALDLAADAPKRVQRTIVRSIIAAERPGVPDDAFYVAYRAARDAWNLARIQDERELRRRQKCRRRWLDRVRQSGEDDRTWAAIRAAARADAALIRRTGRPLPSSGDSAPHSRAGAYEQVQAHAIRGLVASPPRTSHAALEDGMQPPASGAGTQALCPPTPAALAYDAVSMINRLRARKQGRR
jgi:hypothetical protein